MTLLRSIGFAPTRPILALLLTIMIEFVFAVTAGSFGFPPTVAKLLACAIALAVLLGLGKLEKRPLAELGFRSNGLAGFALGLLAGCLLIALIVGLLALTGTYQILKLGFTADFLIWTVTLLFAAMAEEFLFRGVLFRMTEDAWGSVPALIFSSFVFGLIHLANPGATMLSSLAIGLGGGVMLGGVYVLTRSLWVVSGLHLGWNLAQSMFGLQVSGVTHPEIIHARVTGPTLWTGGNFGPEAGLAALIVTLLVSFGILLAATRNGQIRGWLSTET